MGVCRRKREKEEQRGGQVKKGIKRLVLCKIRLVGTLTWLNPVPGHYSLIFLPTVPHQIFLNNPSVHTHFLSLVCMLQGLCASYW